MSSIQGQGVEVSDGGGTGFRFGLSLSAAPVSVYASAAARAAVREAERVTRVAAGLIPPNASERPTRLSELLITEHTARAETHELLRDIADAESALHALRAAVITRLDELQPAPQLLPGARTADPAGPARRVDDWTTDEVACALGIAPATASVMVRRARVLHQQLPRVWAALADSRIDTRRADVITDTLTDRGRSAGGSLDDDVIDDIARQGLAWAGEGIGPTPLTDRLTGALQTADPTASATRAEKRQDQQNVTLTDAGDGLVHLRITNLTAAQAAASTARLDAMAHHLKKNGDTRRLGPRRISAYLTLTGRPWEPLPDDVARAGHSLQLRADLADLDGHGPLTPPCGCSCPGADADPASSADPARSGPLDNAVADPARWTVFNSFTADAADPTTRGSGLSYISGMTVPPDAVTELLHRAGALQLTPAAGGDVWFEIIDTTGRLRALTSTADARRAAARGHGLGPPPSAAGYVPTAAQVRFVRARDLHCRFPGCTRPAEYTDLDHVIAYNHADPTAGGATCVTNLVCLCRRHHRLKTFAADWHFQMDPDGTLHVTPPGGRTRTTRPPTLAATSIAATGIAATTITDPGPACSTGSTGSTGSSGMAGDIGPASAAGGFPAGGPWGDIDPLAHLFGRTPTRYRTLTPDERAARRAAARQRADLAAAIDAELDAALERLARTGTALIPDAPPF